MNSISLTKSRKVTFLDDVIYGLSLKNKMLSSKYFYDADGDSIFQKIMDFQVSGALKQRCANTLKLCCVKSIK